MSVPEVLRILLFLVILTMAVLALMYLGRRRLETSAYLAWGLLAVLLPICGPFLVIALRPGRGRPIPARVSRRRACDRTVS